MSKKHVFGLDTEFWSSQRDVAARVAAVAVVAATVASTPPPPPAKKTTKNTSSCQTMYAKPLSLDFASSSGIPILQV